VRRLVRRLGRGHQVVLPDGSLDSQLAFGDVGAQRPVGLVELAERPPVDRDGQLGGGQVEHDAPARRGDIAWHRDEGDHLAGP
jgi:hypothetical protein